MVFLAMGMPALKESRRRVHYRQTFGEEQLKATITNFCPNAPGEFTLSDRRSEWNGWGSNLWNTRVQTAERAGLTAEQVPNLKVKVGLWISRRHCRFTPTVMADACL